MFDRSVNRFVAAVILFIVGLGLVSCGSPPTRKEIWSQYREHYLDFQEELYRAGSRKWPDSRPVLKKQYDYEKANMKWRTMQFEYLLNNHPNRLYTKGSIYEFINFPWTEKDTRRLLKENPEAKELLDRVKRLKKNHFNHPKWPEVRKKMRSLPSDSQISEVQQTFRNNLLDLERWLKRYRQSRFGRDGGDRRG